jgi:hypothetical protein
VHVIERRRGWLVHGRVGNAVEAVLGVALGFGVVLGVLAIVNMCVPIGALDLGLQLVIIGGAGLAVPGCVRAATALVHIVWRNARTRRLLRAGRYAEVLPSARELVDEAEWVFGYGHKVTTTRRHALCALLWQAGEFEKARGLAERNLEYRLTVLGPDDPDTAASRQLAEMFRTACA